MVLRFIPGVCTVATWITATIIIGVLYPPFVPIPFVGGFGLIYMISPYIIPINWVLHKQKPHKNTFTTTQERITHPKSDVLEEKIQNPETMNPKNFSSIGGPRSFIANLEYNKYVNETNVFIESITTEKHPGSSWGPFKKGGWDFAQVGLTTLLWAHGDSKLKKEAKENVIRLLRKGNTYNLLTTVPKSFGTIYDTENHILMTNTSLYLCNDWLFYKEKDTQKKYDNTRNGVKQWIASFLYGILKKGFYEYNSVPYESYALHPIMNMASYAQDTTIRSLAQGVLDTKIERFILGSVNYKQVAPFRRQVKREDIKRTDASRLAPVIQYYNNDDIRKTEDNVVPIASIAPYTPPRNVMSLLSYTDTYTAQFGHGWFASPEIYSGCKKWLLCAGGIASYLGERIISRATTLLLADDTPETINDCFHIAETENNTGVYDNVAIGKGSLHVPKHYTPIRKGLRWNIYMPVDDVFVCTYKSTRVSVIYVCDANTIEKNVQSLQRELNSLNSQKQIDKDGIITLPHNNTTLQFNVSQSQWRTIINGEFHFMWSLHQKGPRRCESWMY